MLSDLDKINVEAHGTATMLLADGQAGKNTWFYPKGHNKHAALEKIAEKHHFYDETEGRYFGVALDKKRAPLHSTDDHPALTEEYGRSHWLFNGYLHRAFGPAFIQSLSYPDLQSIHSTEYYIFGIQFESASEAAHFQLRHHNWIIECERILTQHILADSSFDIGAHVPAFSSKELFEKEAQSWCLEVKQPGKMHRLYNIKEIINKDRAAALSNTKNKEASPERPLDGLAGALVAAATVAFGTALLKQRKVKKEFERFVTDHKEQIAEFNEFPKVK